MDVPDTGGIGSVDTRPAEAVDPRYERSAFAAPAWARDVGRWSWIVVGCLVVIVANGFLQTLVSQFALGTTLKLHPLVVLVSTTAGSILFGAVGGVFAAPFVKIGLDSVERARQAGVFGTRAATEPIEEGRCSP